MPVRAGVARRGLLLIVTVASSLVPEPPDRLLWEVCAPPVAPRRTTTVASMRAEFPPSAASVCAPGAGRSCCVCGSALDCVVSGGESCWVSQMGVRWSGSCAVAGALLLTSAVTASPAASLSC